MKTYASFCPVAKTSEIIAERWTPLLLREFFMGARRFGEFQQALPQISRALLTQRLRELQYAEVIDRVRVADGARSEYRLTPRGQALRPLIEMMSEWGQVHSAGRIRQEDTDPAQVMWSLRRFIDVDRLPAAMLVVQFQFSGLRAESRNERYWWLVMNRPEVDICQKDPGHAVDVAIIADLLTFTQVWLGKRGLAEAKRAGRLSIAGNVRDVKAVAATLDLREQPWHRQFDFSMRSDPFGPLPGAAGAVGRAGR